MPKTTQSHSDRAYQALCAASDRLNRAALQYGATLHDLNHVPDAWQGARGVLMCEAINFYLEVDRQCSIAHAKEHRAAVTRTGDKAHP